MIQAPSKKAAIVPLYIPVLLSYLLYYSPVLSYFVAWAGSFYVFYQTWFSPSVYLNPDLPRSKQLMRPIFLIQLIFAGFMACTSIFYFLDHIGYRYLTRLNIGDSYLEKEKTFVIAACQRMALLAHVAMVTGFIYFTNRDVVTPRYKIVGGTTMLVKFTVAIYLIGLLLNFLPGLNQIALPLSNIGISCAVIIFLRGIIEKKTANISIGAGIFAINFLNASLSGFKEPIIINIILLVVIFFPYYKRTIIILSIPIFYVIFYLLPTYNAIVRTSWTGEISAETARDQAFETLVGNENSEQISETNWSFLTNRLSEINMFVQFVEHVPEKRDYYGWEIFNNSISALIPRVLWPAKPNVEELSMERVYEAGVANRLSPVSAKTRPVVDAYLSWGIPGVFVSMLVLGGAIQWLCNKSEIWFGSYEFGCIIIFNSLFQNLWRGNNFEFMINNIVYAGLIMFIMWYVVKKIMFLKPIYA